MTNPPDSPVPKPTGFFSAPTAEFELPIDPLGAAPPTLFSSLVQLDIAALSDVGKKRTNNEDSFVIFCTGRYWEHIASNLPDGELPKQYDEKAYVFAVADGMGGMAAGEIASRLALRTGVNLMLHSVKWAHKLDHPYERDREIAEAVQRAREYFEQMDMAVWRRAEKEPELAGMGTTLTTAYSFGRDLFIMNIGDSRAYLVRGGRLEQITHDDTMAQALADAGAIDPEEVATHRLRHVLTQAIGAHGGALRIHWQHREVHDGDRLLMCTDGLTDLADDATIAAVLAQHATSQSACRALVDLALERGGADNVTVIVAGYRMPTEG
jgi:protein phosphatase